MRITAESAGGFAVVRASGLLDLPSAPDLRDALLKAAAEQPQAIVCDLRQVVAEATALTVLLVVADQVEAWPSCPMAVLVADPAMRSLLARVGVDHHARLAADLGELASAVPPPVPAPGATLHMTASRRAPGQARAFLRTAVSRAAHAPDVDLDAADLVVGELVTNAVLHAGTDVDLLVSVRPDALRIAVADGSPGGPTGRDAHGDDENGRGLALVDALSARWGVFPRRPGGKVVWAVLPPPSAPASSAREAAPRAS